MAITSYAELQAAAANWLVRGDLTARIPEFITLAEARLNRLLRTRLAEVEVTVTTSPGARRAPLPPGFTEPLRLWLACGETRTELPFRPAELIGPRGPMGAPQAWSVDGAWLVLDRPADAARTLILRMLRRYQLSEAQPANDLLTDSPDVYLFATLCEAAPFLRDVDLAGAYDRRLAQAIDDLNAKEARSRAPRTLATEIPLILERSC